MKCPVDGEVLVISDRTGIEIDYCPGCRGVWLDRGELDKIIERSLPPDARFGATEPSRSAPSPAPGYYDQVSKHGSGHDSRGGHDGHQQSGRRRGGWLSELFD